MNVGGEFAAFAVAAVVSLLTSWLLVTRLERVGERLRFTEGLLGLVAALAADAPEITASITALAHHQRDVGAGVVIGSNVFNLAALLGLGAIVAGRIDLHRRVVLFAGFVATWIAIVCFGAIGGAIGPGAGLALGCVVFIPYVAVLSIRHRGLAALGVPERWSTWLARAVEEEELELDAAIRPQRGRARDVAVAGGALCVVVTASIVMERTATTLGSHFSIPGIIVGGVVLAAVTSLPNAVAAIYLAAKGRGAAMLSTALNSNSINVIAGLLIPSVFLGLSAPSGTSLLVGGSYVGLTVLALGLAYADRGLRRASGWVIVAGYAAFVGVLFAVS